MKKLLLSLASVIFIFTISFSQTEFSKAQDYLQNKGEVYFKFTIDEPSVLLELTRKISIDNLDGLEIFAYANTMEFTKFLEYGFNYQVLEHPGDLLKNPEMYDSSKGIWQFDTYPTYDEYINMMYTFQTNYPQLCKIHDIGATNDGRRLLFAQISDNVSTREVEPRFMYTSSMHGDETTGYILMMHLIDYLLSNYASDSEVQDIVNNIELWIMPLENPDGTYAGGNNTVSGSTRGNANNIDLNRNYKNPVDGDHPDGYAWQIETIEMMDFIDSLHFVMSANFHGGAELANYPWDSWYSATNPIADNDWWEMVATEYATHAQTNSPAGYFEDLGDGVTHGADWYLITGGRQDYANYYGRCREMTLEVSATKTLAEGNLIAFWNYNRQALLDYIKQCKFGIRGLITDACTGNPMVANVFITGLDADNTDQYSEMPLGDYYRPILAGTYNVVVSAPGYVSQTFNNVSASNYSATVLNVSLAPAAPVSDFVADVVLSCTGAINFVSAASGVDTWLWNFGDGNTSTDENPSHTYTADGTYTVSLTVTNCAGLGTDTETKISYIIVDLPAAPTVTPNDRCGLGSVNLTASGSGTINWYDSETGGTLLGSGSPFSTPSITNTTTYYAEDVTTSGGGSYNVGETSSDVSGGYHNASGAYYIIFDAFSEFVLNSVEINAETATNSTIALRNSSGTTLQSVTVSHPAGVSRVDLNFDVPIGTEMRLVLTSTNNLWRTNVEAILDFPYEITDVVSITNTNATNPIQFYYYFYDWAITVPGAECVSARVPVLATINNPATLIMSSTSESTPGANDGTATVSPSGSPSFTYLWTGGQTSITATGLSEGNYCVTVTDGNSCQSVDCVDVSVGSVALTSSATVNANPTCFGFCDGTATVSPSGGTGSYTYLWDNGETTASASALCSGNHTVTVSDGSTTTSSNILLIQPSGLSASTTQVNVSCYGASTGSATVSASAGTPGYSYLWSSGGTLATETGLDAGAYNIVVTDANGCTVAESVTITEPTALVTSTSITDVTCYGASTGSATVSASAGTPGYSYLWSSGGTLATETGLDAGAYNIVVTDANGCTVSESVTITQPTALVTSTSITDVACYGASTGSATVSASAGTPGYSYLWSSGGTLATETGLDAGAYNIVVTDANGCTVSESVSISQPLDLTYSISSSDATCGNADGSVSVSASGGTGSYSYLWSSGGTNATETGLISGTYSCQIVDDNGCSVSAIVSISDSDGPSAIISDFTEVSCFGSSTGSATVTASGGTIPYSYSWSSGGVAAFETGLAAGTYTVIVTDQNNCVASESVTIVEPSAISYSATTNDASCGNSDGEANLIVSGGTGTYLFLWSSGGNSATEAGLSAGTYFCTITDENACEETAYITILSSDGPEIICETTNVSCYGGIDGVIASFAYSGTSPYSFLWSDGSVLALNTELSAGTYSVTVTDDAGCASVQTVSLSEPPAINVLSEINDSDCSMANGSIILTVSGGTPSYSYEWSGGQTTSTIIDLEAGNYEISVHDANNCLITESFVINSLGGPEISVSSNDVSCFGESNGVGVVFVFGGTAPYLYNWSNGGTSSIQSNLSAGNHSVTILDANDCSAFAEITINQPTEIETVISWTPVSEFGVFDGTAEIIASNGVSPYSYLWSNGSTEYFINGLDVGYYYCTVTDNNGCEVIDTVFIDFLENIVDLNSLEISMFPNPCNGQFVITSNIELQRISIENNLGSLITEINNPKQSQLINLEKQSPGLYFVRIYTSRGVVVKKLIVSL